MGRKAPIITMDEFKEKFIQAAQTAAIASGDFEKEDLEEEAESIRSSALYYLYYHNAKFNSDVCKIDFDWENYYTPSFKGDEDLATSDSYTGLDEKGVVGFNTLPSGIPFLGGWAGGDWEMAVYFVVYWDGKAIRAYVPKDGNTYHPVYKTAYGSEGNSELYVDDAHNMAYIEKTFGVKWEDFDGEAYKYVKLDGPAFIADANARIEVK